jgi:hypothetical protein
MSEEGSGRRRRPQGRPQMPVADKPVDDVPGIPEIEVTVVMRRGEEIVATERFSVPFLPTPETAREYSLALGRHFSKAVGAVIDVLKRSV